MKIILTGLEEFALGGEYELDTHPTGREMNRFRKEAEMSPSDLTDAIVNGGLDVVRLYAYTALDRAGSPLAGRILDLPLDRLRGIEVETDEEEAEEGGQPVPPTPGSASLESERSSGEPSGLTSPGSSALQD